MLVASIDVGITHLALVFARISESFQLIRVQRTECVDSTQFEHTRVSAELCTLGHTKTTADRIAHVVQERQHLFDACHHILIERQPLQGHTHVEQVLFMLFRARASLVSPNAMHKHFRINHFTYEGRKQQVVRIVDELLPLHHFPHYHSLERKHDVADAICLLLFWLHEQQQRKVCMRVVPCKQADAEVADEPVQLPADTITQFAQAMERFRYKKK
jgi:Holliday junction resolvasome RuvABC endonuclease subunit